MASYMLMQLNKPVVGSIICLCAGIVKTKGLTGLATSGLVAANGHMAGGECSEWPEFSQHWFSCCSNTEFAC